MGLGRTVMVLTMLCLTAGAGTAEAAERGKASIYADHFNGRRTASGEVFRQSKATAAHRKLPLGSVLKVTNTRNGRSVLVTVNDRGPFNRRWVIDLSRSAAQQLALGSAADVELEVVRSR